MNKTGKQVSQKFVIKNINSGHYLTVIFGKEFGAAFNPLILKKEEEIESGDDAPTKQFDSYEDAENTILNELPIGNYQVEKLYIKTA